MEDRIVESETLLETKRFRVARVEYTSPRGVHQRDVIRHPGAVTVIPLVDENHVCLIRQNRPAVAKMLIELPAGTLEPGEPPAVTAERELIEETGYRAEKLELIHEFFLSPGILDERMFLFSAVGLSEGETAREAGEEIDNYVVSWDEAMDLCHRGEIEDAKTLVGLMRYDYIRRRGSS